MSFLDLWMIEDLMTDLILSLDGLHKSYQVKQDIHNSLRYLNPNGYILLHDCNPPTSFMAREDYLVDGEYREEWPNMEVDISIKNKNDLKVCVVDTDWVLVLLKTITSSTLHLYKDTIHFMSLISWTQTEKKTV